MRRLDIEIEENMEVLREVLRVVKYIHQTSMRRVINFFRKKKGFVRAKSIKLMKIIRGVNNIGNLDVLIEQVNTLVDDANEMTTMMQDYDEFYE